MAKIIDIIEKIEAFAPPETAAQWDNSGWQVKLDDKIDIKKVMIALSPTFDVIEQSIENSCNLVITHHPLIFSGIKNIIPETLINKILIKAIQNNIQIYSAHTNLDVAKGGVSDVLAELIGLKDIYTQDEFVKIGELEQPQELEAFSLAVKHALKADALKLVNKSEKLFVKKIAVCGGAGADFIQSLTGKEIDVYITGDIKYHQAIDTVDFALIDAGHMETELPVLKVLQSEISSLGVETLIAKEFTPWKAL